MINHAIAPSQPSKPMRAAPLILVVLASSLTGCTSFRALPLSDVTPPRTISLRSPQPFVAQSAAAPGCRVTLITGPFAGATEDSIFLASVNAVVRAPSGQAPCTPWGRTAVATAELRMSEDAQVLSKQFSVGKTTALASSVAGVVVITVLVISAVLAAAFGG